MSQQAVHGFIEKVSSDAKLGAIVTQAIAQNSERDLVKLAGEYGFAFSREEGLKVWEEIQAKGELPDALLEAVAGGCPIDCTGKNGNT